MLRMSRNGAELWNQFNVTREHISTCGSKAEDSLAAWPVFAGAGHRTDILCNLTRGVCPKASICQHLDIVEIRKIKALPEQLRPTPARMSQTFASEIPMRIFGHRQE